MYLYCLNPLVLLMIPGALTFIEVVDGTLVHDHGTCYIVVFVFCVYSWKSPMDRTLFSDRELAE